VYVAPLEAVVDEVGTEPPGRQSVQSLAELVANMVTAGSSADSAAAPPALRPVLERALESGSGYATPTAFVQAAREAIAEQTGRPPVGRRRGAVVGGAVVAVAAVASVAGLVLTRSDESPPSAQAPARPAGPVAATIPLGHGPRSLAIGFGSVWVATADGTIVEVDPTAERVVGAPIRFGPANPNSNLTVRAGAGALFVLDGAAGTATRIDPVRRRVTTRVRVGQSLDGATVQDGVLWVTRSTAENVRPARSELVRFDARRLRQIGKPIRVDAIPYDIEVQAGTAWVTSVAEGTVTRFDARTGKTRAVRVAGQPIGSALRGETLWVPDAVGGLVLALDAVNLKLPKDVVRLTRAPYSAAATDDAVWVTAQDQHGSNFLYRIDPDRRAVAGRPVPLGPGTGWVSAGEGALWVGTNAKNALLKVVPATPPPDLLSPPATPGPAKIVNGPLAPGSLRTGSFAAPFSVSLQEPGWLAFAAAPDVVAIGRFEALNSYVEIAIPRQLFTADGSSRRVRSEEQILDLLEANRRISTGPRARTTLGGRPATRVSLTALPRDDYPSICPEACAFLFGAEGTSFAIHRSIPTTLFVLTHRGKVVVVLQFMGGERARAQTSALLRSLRFR
jgi:outer membrane protein assembly factor BamB